MLHSKKKKKNKKKRLSEWARIENFLIVYAVSSGSLVRCDHHGSYHFRHFDYIAIKIEKVIVKEIWKQINLNYLYVQKYVLERCNVTLSFNLCTKVTHFANE